MKKILRTCVLLASVLSLGACSLVYQSPKQEGTALNSQQITQIAKGQNKEQVEYILGNPNIVYSVSENVWFYVQRDISSHGKITEKIFEVVFNNDNLVQSFGYVQKLPTNESSK